MEAKCSKCRVQACDVPPGTKSYPSFCPMVQDSNALQRARDKYDDETTMAFARAAAQTEAAGYCKDTRIEEIVKFARRLGYRKLGIANCIGLLREAWILQEVFEANGFEVHSICCKVGSIPKEDIGLAQEDKIHPGQFEVLCNPIGQAHVLNEAGTDLNVVVGLCVGHDSLFFKHSEAPVTVLVAKDRVTCHNPISTLYTSHSYYHRIYDIGE